MSLLHGKTGLVIGVANERSLATAIARIVTEEGAKIGITYQGPKLASRADAIAEEVGALGAWPLDVSDSSAVSGFANTVSNAMSKVDFVVHAVAFARREELEGRFLDTSPEGFSEALRVSCYSLVEILRALEGQLTENASVLTLSYYGAEKAVPHYDVMGVAKAALEASVRYLAMELGPKGVRVNAISAGPVRTLSAAGIKGFKKMHAHAAKVAPLRRNMEAEDIASSALYCLSDLSSGVTGEVIHVDGGFHAVGSAPEE